MGKVATKAMRVARGTALTMGVAVMLALVVGVSTTALAGTGVGARFDLGKTNTVNAITKLVGGVAGPSLQIDNNSTDAAATALDLQVEAGKAPLKVNSDAQVANLNSDKLDGKSANEIGVNNIGVSGSISASNSDSPKTQTVACAPGKLLVGTGYDIEGGKSGSAPNQEANVVIDRLDPTNFSSNNAFPPTGVIVEAYEEEPTSANWTLSARAICAKAP